MLSLKDEELNFIKNNELEIKIYVGENNDYYISAWTVKPKFNFAGFFGGVFWFGYRGMFGMVFSLLAIASLLFAVLKVPYSKEFGFVFAGVGGICGNKLFYHKVKKDILKNKKPINPFLGVFITLLMLCLFLFISIIALYI